MRHDPASGAIIIMLRSLKMHGMAQAVTDLMEQAAPAFDAAVPMLAQLLKAELAEREVLESFVTKTRDKKAALKFLRKAMRKHGQPDVIITDKLRSYGAALKELGAGARQETGRWMNNRAENSHLPFRRRERAMLGFRRMRSLQKFASVHASVSNHFNQDRNLSSRNIFKLNRTAALTEWRGLCAA